MDNKEIAFVMAVGKGKTLDKSYYLAKSIKNIYPDAEIFAFVAEEEKKDIPLHKLFKIQRHASLIYGEIPMKEYIFTVKHQALIQAGSQTDAKYLACLDSDMLLLDPLHLDHDFEMFVCPVDIGNTSWGRERSRLLWEKLYKMVGSKMPEEKLTSLVGNYSMFPYFNGGFVITSDHKFGQNWLDTTKKVFKELPDRESYEKTYSQQTKRRRLFTKIPYSHWTEQVALTLLASKYKTKILPYEYDWPLNTMWKCHSDVKIIHYHDIRNLLKIRNHHILLSLNQLGLDKELEKYNKIVEVPRMLAYQALRSIKIKMGKF